MGIIREHQENNISQDKRKPSVQKVTPTHRIFFFLSLAILIGALYGFCYGSFTHPILIALGYIGIILGGVCTVISAITLVTKQS